jgi:hypothetical protein
MPKSRKRGGEKAHRKRVQTRNNKIQNQRTRIQKLWEEEMMKRMQEINAQSGSTENEEVDESQPLDLSV